MKIFLCTIFFLTSCSQFTHSSEKFKCLKDLRTGEIFYLRDEMELELNLVSLENKRQITVKKPTNFYQETLCVIQDKFKTIH